MLYELLTGVRPLKRDSEMATLQAALECKIEPPSVVAEVPAELDDVVMRALAKTADDRYRDARTFQMALEEYLIGQRLVATSSVQISELMETLFADRLAEEERLGVPNPAGAESISASPAVPEPPGWDSQRKSRSSNPSYEPSQHTEPVRPDSVSIQTDMARPGEAGRASATPQVEDWEAPPAQQVLPSRRYAQSGPSARADDSGNTESQRAHRPEETRARPPTRAEVPASEEPVRPSRLAGRRNSALAPRLEDPISRETEAVEPQVATPLPRRTSSGGLKKRTASGNAMPEAPRRKSRPEVPVARRSSLSKVPSLDEELEAPKDSTADRLVGLPELRESQARRARVVLMLAAVLGLALFAFVFKDTFRTLFNVGGGGKTPILLTVMTNPKTTVFVVPKDDPKHPLDLGVGPSKREGVYVGDTIQLVNQDIGIFYEEEIPFGEPGKERLIEKQFAEGQLTVATSPRPDPARCPLAIYRNGQKLGQVGLRLKLYEGKQSLELRGECLKAPVGFEAQIEAGKSKTATVDITPALAKD